MCKQVVSVSLEAAHHRYLGFKLPPFGCSNLSHYVCVHACVSCCTATSAVVQPARDCAGQAVQDAAPALHATLRSWRQQPLKDRQTGGSWCRSTAPLASLQAHKLCVFVCLNRQQQQPRCSAELVVCALGGWWLLQTEAVCMRGLWTAARAEGLCVGHSSSWESDSCTLDAVPSFELQQGGVNLFG